MSNLYIPKKFRRYDSHKDDMFFHDTASSMNKDKPHTVIENEPFSGVRLTGKVRNSLTFTSNKRHDACPKMAVADSDIGQIEISISELVFALTFWKDHENESVLSEMLFILARDTYNSVTCAVCLGSPAHAAALGETQRRKDYSAKSKISVKYLKDNYGELLGLE